jgi:hypothetical protein
MSGLLLDQREAKFAQFSGFCAVSSVALPNA